jgi:hypothetical protein
MGFGRKWRGWITMLLASVLVSILNGILAPSIWHAHGLRQGDALSPMVFILVMEALILFYAKAEEDGMISPFPISRNNPQRLFVYPNDVIIFLETSGNKAVLLKLVLDIFGGATRL